METLKTQRDVSYAAFMKMLDRVANPQVKPRKPLVQLTDAEGRLVFISHTRRTKKHPLINGQRQVVKTTPVMRYA